VYVLKKQDSLIHMNVWVNIYPQNIVFYCVSFLKNIKFKKQVIIIF